MGYEYIQGVPAIWNGSQWVFFYVHPRNEDLVFEMPLWYCLDSWEDRLGELQEELVKEARIPYFYTEKDDRMIRKRKHMPRDSPKKKRI